MRILLRGQILRCKSTFLENLRLYFAPLTGAYRGVCEELKHSEETAYHVRGRLHGWNALLKKSVRLYFAPLTGAYRGVRDEWRRVGARHRQVD
jgi:hypothetical protein